MPLRRVNFRVRTLMIFIVVVALAIGVVIDWRRAAEFRRRARHYRNLAYAAHIQGFSATVGRQRMPRNLRVMPQAIADAEAIGRGTPGILFPDNPAARLTPGRYTEFPGLACNAPS